MNPESGVWDRETGERFDLDRLVAAVRLEPPRPTLNPKVAGSNPARPCERLGPAELNSAACVDLDPARSSSLGKAGPDDEKERR